MEEYISVVSFSSLKVIGKKFCGKNFLVCMFGNECFVSCRQLYTCNDRLQIRCFSGSHTCSSYFRVVSHRHVFAPCFSNFSAYRSVPLLHIYLFIAYYLGRNFFVTCVQFQWLLTCFEVGCARVVEPPNRMDIIVQSPQQYRHFKFLSRETSSATDHVLCNQQGVMCNFADVFCICYM